MLAVRPDRMSELDPNKPAPSLPSGAPSAAAELTPAKLVELSRAAAAGDHQAVATLHARFAPGLLRLFLKRTRGREDLADDLAQRCWTLAWDAIRRGKYDPDRASVSTFVYAVASNVWLQHLRKSGRSIEVSAPITESPDFSGPSADDSANAELLQAVRDAVGGLTGAKGPAPEPSDAPSHAGLNEEERSIVRMMAAGMSDRAVATQMGLAPSTVNVKKRGAFEKIRRFLASRGHRGSE
ncbi:MAG: RNA polymerase sigma factor [Phycisphaerales bacterium]